MSFFTDSEHGGDIYGFQTQYGRRPLDFSVNVNPAGPPESVRKAAEKAVSAVSEYPDPAQRELVKALAEKNQLENWQILPGAGASDIIYRIVFSRRPGRAVITAPTFSEYERALRAAGSAVSRFLLREEDEFLLDGRIDDLLDLAERDPEIPESGSAEMIILCEPNNPTGRTTGKDALLRLLRACRERKITLLVDESFLWLLDDPLNHTMLSEGKECSNLILLRSFTKIFSMPGIRLGYGIFFNRDWREQAEACGPSWPVSCGAEAAGLAALQESGYIERYRQQNRKERAYLKKQLESLAGIHFVSDGQANYLLIHADRELAEPLAEKGILVRDCSNYYGLDGHWIRICVRKHEDNQLLIQAVRDCLQEKGRRLG
ncbi:MAG: pyridoxal phosphate-dependent aminotransferase [Eubacterium sp.]